MQGYTSEKSDIIDFIVFPLLILGYTRPVQKVSDLWPGKIHLHAWKSATLSPFKVVSL